jgi:hypothetical protein
MEKAKTRLELMKEQAHKLVSLLDNPGGNFSWQGAVHEVMAELNRVYEADLKKE